MYYMITNYKNIYLPDNQKSMYNYKRLKVKNMDKLSIFKVCYTDRLYHSVFSIPCGDNGNYTL